MSMYRQFWLAIITCMLLAFGGSLIASMLSARAYLESQLSIKNSDNAAALALSMSQSNPDAVMIELTVAALFDSGHYELVRVVDPKDGRLPNAPVGHWISMRRSGLRAGCRFAPCRARRRSARAGSRSVR
jgi:hypothetical protein